MNKSLHDNFYSYFCSLENFSLSQIIISYDNSNQVIFGVGFETIFLSQIYLFKKVVSKL